MYRYVAGALIAFILICGQSNAAKLHPGFISNPPATTSAALVGFSNADFPFVNYIKNMGFAFPTSVTSPPSFLTTNQFPNGTLTGQYSAFSQTPTSYLGEYVLAVTGTVSGGSGIQFGDGTVGTIYSTTGSPTITGCTGFPTFPCTVQNNWQVTGTNFSVTFGLSILITGAVNNGSGNVQLTALHGTTGYFKVGAAVTVTGVVGSDGNGCGANGEWTITASTSTTMDITAPFDSGCTYTSGGQVFPFQKEITTFQSEFDVIFSSGATFSGLTAVCIAKQADYAADNTCNTTAGKSAWPGGFNDDFVQSLAHLRPRYIRFLDVNGPFAGAPEFANSVQPNWMSFTGNPPQARWFGTSSGTNSYSVTCVSPCTYALTGGAPADGDAVYATIANTNTSLSPMLQVTDINGATSSALPITDSEGNMSYLHVTAGVVTGAADNGSGLVRLTVVNTIPNGSTVSITGVVGSSGSCGADGNFVVSNASGTTIDLVGSTFPGGCTYTSGGAVVVVGETVTVAYASTCITGGSASVSYTTVAGDSVQSIWVGLINQSIINGTSVGSVGLATAGAVLPNSPTYSNGSSGVGATLTAGSNSTLTVDGSVAALNSIVLVKDQASTFQNGVYKVTQAGSGSVPWILTRATNFDQSTEMLNGSHMVITGGTVNIGLTYALQATVTTVGTTPAIFVVYNTSLMSLPLGFYTDGGGGSPTIVLRWAYAGCTDFTATPSTNGTGTEAVVWGTRTVAAVLAVNSACTPSCPSPIHLFNYSVAMGRWIDAGYRGGWPWLTQIQLTNAVSTAANVNTGCWLQTNLLWSLASHAALDSYLVSNPCTGGNFREISNEIWNNSNPETHIADNIGTALGLNPSYNEFPRIGYLMLRSAQAYQAAIATFATAGQSALLHPILAFQTGSATANFLNGVGLCGSSCTPIANPAYQAVIGTDYNTSPTQPHNFVTAISQAPYYNGSILAGQANYPNGAYSTSTSYGTWLSTAASVTSNVLTVGGTITGTVYPNQGISSCDGTYIANPTPANWSSGQLTGTITTTLTATPTTSTWSVASTSGLSVGMWVYDQTTQLISGTILSIGSGTVTVAGGPGGTGSATLYINNGVANSGDTLVFGGLAGTYQLNSTSCSVATGTISGGDILGLQYAADNYNQLSGALGSQQDGLNWVYQDNLVSVKKGSMSNSTTVKSYINYYNIMKNVGGYGLPVQEYEGGLAETPPTPTQATALGLPSGLYGGAGIYDTGNGSTPLGGYISVLLYGFKTSSLFKQLEIIRHNDALAIETAGSVTTKFNFETTSMWGIFPLSLYYPPPYQDYNAICTINGGTGC